MQVDKKYTQQAAFRSTAGFTLFEITIVTLIIGILSAIAAPTWIAFVNRQLLNTAQYQVYQAIQEAKSNAKLQKVTWQFSIRESDNVAQWAVHPVTVNPANAQWNNLDKTVHIDPETTLEHSGDVNRIQFDYHGNVAKPPLGRVTLSSQHGGKAKRCVFVSTLIGTLRTAKENPKPNQEDGRYCY
jgi:prepilin-type N-terminal cleavage/methylation domain-containing protein